MPAPEPPTRSQGRAWREVTTIDWPPPSPRRRGRLFILAILGVHFSRRRDHPVVLRRGALVRLARLLGRLLDVAQPAGLGLSRVRRHHLPDPVFRLPGAEAGAPRRARRRDDSRQWSADPPAGGAGHSADRHRRRRGHRAHHRAGDVVGVEHVRALLARRSRSARRGGHRRRRHRSDLRAAAGLLPVHAARLGAPRRLADDAERGVARRGRRRSR